MKAILLFLFLSMFMLGCATSYQVPPNYTLLETHSSIPLYGVNIDNPPKDYKFISQVSMTRPVQPYQVSGIESPYFDPRLGYSIRAKAILVGANAVVNVRKKIMEIPVEDEFGKRRQRVLVTSGDAVFDQSSKKRFITPELVELFNRKVLGLPKMKGRDELGNMFGWRFFLTPDGDVLCEREEFVGSMKGLFVYDKEASSWIGVGSPWGKLIVNRVLIKSDQLKAYAY